MRRVTADLATSSSAASGGDRTLFVAAIVAAAGALLSGPLAVALSLLRPQPAWRDAATFIAHYHPLQQAAYALGFVLLSGTILFVARVYAIAGERHRTQAAVALMAAGIYGAMIFTNYTMQLVVVPHLVRAGDPLVAYVTMTNPGSPSWALEMFGYVALGVATWMTGLMLDGGGRRRAWARGLFIANGPISIAGALVTARELTWVMSGAGLVSFVGWNLLLIVAMTLAALEFRPRHEAR